MYQSIYLSVCFFVCLFVCLFLSLYAVNVLYVYMHGSVCICGCVRMYLLSFMYPTWNMYGWFNIPFRARAAATRFFFGGAWRGKRNIKVSWSVFLADMCGEVWCDQTGFVSNLRKWIQNQTDKRTKWNTDGKHGNYIFAFAACWYFPVRGMDP